MSGGDTGTAIGLYAMLTASSGMYVALTRWASLCGNGFVNDIGCSVWLISGACGETALMVGSLEFASFFNIGKLSGASLNLLLVFGMLDWLSLSGVLPGLTCLLRSGKEEGKMVAISKSTGLTCLLRSGKGEGGVVAISKATGQT